MISILLMAPRCDGPGNGCKWNTFWPKDLEDKVDENYWNVFAGGILVLAAIAKNMGFDVDVVDENSMEYHSDKNYDIAAFYTVTPNVKRCIELSEHLRKQGTYIVFGGVHASLCYDDVKEYAETVLIGEGEYIWKQFLEDYQNHAARKSYLQEIGQVNIEDSPIPAFELMTISYNRPLVPIQTARGCPHGCRFCNLHSLYGKGYRMKSISKVKQEIEAARKVFNNPIIYFTDDNLFCNKNRSREFLVMVKQFNMIWYANTDVSFGMDEELIQEACKSGCRRVLIGFESIDKEHLNNIDPKNFKSNYRDHYTEAIHNIQSRGIGIVGSFIVGFEDDTQESFQEMYHFIQDNGLSGTSITVNTPYPGSELYQQLSKEKKIITYDWNQYTIFQLVIKLKNMNVDEFNQEYIKLLYSLNSEAAVAHRRTIIKEAMKQRLASSGD